jgi:hypothetical protein
MSILKATANGKAENNVRLKNIRLDSYNTSIDNSTLMLSSPNALSPTHLMDPGFSTTNRDLHES